MNSSSLLSLPQVLHLHVLLGLQDLLRLRLHVAGLSHSHHCHHLRDNRLHLFLAQRRGLSMAVDFIPLGRLHVHLRLHLRLLLFLLQDQVSSRNGNCPRVFTQIPFFSLPECTDCSKQSSTLATWRCLAALSASSAEPSDTLERKFS